MLREQFQGKRQKELADLGAQLAQGVRNSSILQRSVMMMMKDLRRMQLRNSQQSEYPMKGQYCCTGKCDG
jgi:hypothetical protein